MADNVKYMTAKSWDWIITFFSIETFLFFSNKTVSCSWGRRRGPKSPCPSSEWRPFFSCFRTSLESWKLFAVEFENHWYSPTPSFFRWGNWTWEKLSDWPKLAKLVSGELRLELLVFLPYLTVPLTKWKYRVQIHIIKIPLLKESLFVEMVFRLKSWRNVK